jgi:pyridoxal phosphate enzyme (YggS family)
MEALNEFTRRIREVAASAGREDLPCLIAVSKFQTVERMLGLYEQGQRDFGENYVQELLAKHEDLTRRGVKDVRFHFIGKLQSNKVKQLLPVVEAIHSVDSLKLLREIDKCGRAIDKRISVFFQVNIDQEPTKGGFLPDELGPLLREVGAFTAVVPSGLMAIPDPARDPEDAFRRMAQLSRCHAPVLGAGLSMGMSADFEKAIQQGATHVRIGTALFGERRRT